MSDADTRVPTSLQKFAHLSQEPHREHAFDVARKAWHRDGTVLFPAEVIDKMPWQDQALITKICEKNYGRRK